MGHMMTSNRNRRVPGLEKSGWLNTLEYSFLFNMNRVSTILVAPKKKFLNVTLKSLGNPVKGEVLKVSGMGVVTTYNNGAIGMVCMQVKGKHSLMCNRIEVAWKKLRNLKRVGVILPGFTEDWMRANQFPVRFSMYLLNDVEALGSFLGPMLRTIVPLNTIYAIAAPPRARAPPAKKRKRKKKTPPIDLDDMPERAIEPETCNREEETCTVCFDNKITHMCVPCTHYVLCGVCAHKLKDNGDGCPLCREAIKSFITPIQK